MPQKEIIEIARRRAAVLGTIRQYFLTQDFIEVDTPVLLSAPAPEPHIEAPLVHINEPNGQNVRYLQTSPELPMKRLLGAGLDRIFQVAPVFRQGDFSPTHRPEFRMLEWYRRGEGWHTLLHDCENLLRECAERVNGSAHLNYAGQNIDLRADFRRCTMDEAFLEYVGFSILDQLETDQLKATLDRLNVHHDPSDTWDDLFHRVFLERVEPKLLADPRPLFLTHYPAPLAALAEESAQRIRERLNALNFTQLASSSPMALGS